MAGGVITPREKIQDCLKRKVNFVLQGGAGSGKTETLKQTLEYISDRLPQNTVACITHTNLAVDEIKSRVEGDYTISTIHAFLNSIIGSYKKNIRSVMSIIFQVDHVIPITLEEVDGDEKEFKQANHSAYKKAYSNWANKMWSVRGQRTEKVMGKRDYDASPLSANDALNAAIDELNEYIYKDIISRDYKAIQYNDTPFDDYKELTYGHDGLLLIASELFKKYPPMGRILQDKFDIIFIDEYQDTSPYVIDVFLNHMPGPKRSTIGLFGDSMQAIYQDGVGDVEKYVAAKKIVKIEKEDNFRCSPEVIEFINKLRNDGLKQALALKLEDNGKLEGVEKRLGSVKLVYGIVPSKPAMRAPKEDKEAYADMLNSLISYSDKSVENLRHLKLTNRSISTDVGFKYLYDTFADRFVDPKDSIEKILTRLQIAELYELTNAYEKKLYNAVFSSLKKSGFSLTCSTDKVEIAEKFEKMAGYKGSAIGGIDLAISLGLLKKSETHKTYVERREAFLTQLLGSPKYAEFKDCYHSGNNTFTKMHKITLIEEDDFNDLEKDLIQERFYISLFSEDLTLEQTFNYFRYVEEKTKFVTMHKTKGSGIENVLVVLDEYFWNEYDFKSIYSPAIDPKSIRKKDKNLKLVYVACSRAKKNLVCLKIIDSTEEQSLLELFQGADIEKVDLGNKNLNLYPNT